MNNSVAHRLNPCHLHEPHVYEQVDGKDLRTTQPERDRIEGGAYKETKEQYDAEAISKASPKGNKESVATKGLTTKS